MGVGGSLNQSSIVEWNGQGRGRDYDHARMESKGHEHKGLFEFVSLGFLGGGWSIHSAR